jgi:hypothetical protein
LQGKWGQFAREGEDDMHVAGALTLIQNPSQNCRRGRDSSLFCVR